jgi:hypothetical protein
MADQISLMNRTTVHDTVLDTAELLEAILLHLSSRDILVNAQRVCKNWKQAISDSPSIQTKLWLRPRTRELIFPTGCLLDKPYWRELHRGPALDLDSRYSLMLGPPWYDTDQVTHNDFFLRILPANQRGRPSYLAPTRSALGAPTPGLPGYRAYVFRKPKQKHDIQGVQPTWLDMYLTSPRISVMHLLVLLPVLRLGEPAIVEVEVSIREVDGVTFRSMVDVVDEVCRSHLCQMSGDVLEHESKVTATGGFSIGR